MKPSEAGDGIISNVGRWSFGGDVPQRFDAHVSKSVPGYIEGHNLICDILPFFSMHGGLICDIGCSTGVLTQKMSEKVVGLSDVIGIDVEESMIELARKRTEGLNNVSYFVGSFLEAEIDTCDVCVAYYTLQFISPKFRQLAVDKIYESLRWGGAFILFEKIRGADARFQDIYTALYHDFKIDQGYSPAEVMNKSRSLRGILEPFSLAGNMELLNRAGFKDVAPVFQNLCFQGLLAVK